jgi:phage-related protein
MSVKGYSDYEQLAGGVEKIFDKANISGIMEDANNAYKDLNMSANQYLAAINQTGATFAQTMGDQKGYDTARTGMKAIADYASGTGRSLDELNDKYALITRSTSSYQSIADQFSGILPATSQDFLEQAQAAGFLSDSYSKLTEVPIDEYQAAVTNMLKKGVTDMGLYGNTAKEAATTIQGSLAMTKSAWENLVTGLADENANLDELVNNFFDSIMTVGDNIIPRIGIILDGIAKAVEKIAPKIIQALPGVLNKLLPEVVKGAQALLKAFVGVLPQLIKLITDALPDIITAVTDISNAIVDALPEIVGTIADALPTLIPQIVTAITDMVVYLMEHTSEIIQPIIDKLPDIIISIVDALMDNLPSLIDGLITFTLGIVNATPQIIMGLLQALPTIIEKIVTGLLNCLPQLIEGAIQVVIGLVAHLPEIIMGLIQAIPEIVVSIAQALIQAAPKIWEAFTEIFSKAWTKIQEIFAGVGEWFTNMFSKAWEGIKGIWNNVVGFFQGIWNGIVGIFQGVGNWFRGIFQGAVSGIKAAFNGVKTWFQNLWNGIWSVIKTPINWIIDGINTIIDGLNSLSIKVPDWVPFVGGQTWGVNIPKIAKLAKGGIVDSGTPFIAGEAGAEAVIPLENNNQWIYKFAHAFADGLSAFYDGDNFTQTPNKGAGGKIININLYLDNVNVKNDDDIEDVANKVSERIAEKLVVEGMAVG